MNGPFSFKRQPTKEEGETSMPLLPMLLNRERREHATGPIRIKWRRPEEGGRGIEWWPQKESQREAKKAFGWRNPKWPIVTRGLTEEGLNGSAAANDGQETEPHRWTRSWFAKPEGSELEGAAVGAHADASAIQGPSRRVEVGGGLFSVATANFDRKHSECSSTQLNSRVALMCSLIIYGQGGLHFQLPTDSTLVRHWAPSALLDAVNVDVSWMLLFLSFCCRSAAADKRVFVTGNKKRRIVRFHSVLFLRPTGVHDAHWGAEMFLFFCLVILQVSLARLLFYFASFGLLFLISKL